MGFRKKVTVLRTSTGTVGDDGRYTAGSTNTMTIKASVQPLSAKEAYTIVGADGTRNASYVKAYTDVRLYPKTSSEASQTYPYSDAIKIDDRTFDVIQCDAFQSGVINHYRAYCKEVLPDDKQSA